MYVYMYIHTYIHTYTYININININTDTYMQGWRVFFTLPWVKQILLLPAPGDTAHNNNAHHLFNYTITLLGFILTLLFHYHEDRSKKLNAYSSCISRMVYFQPEHRNLIIYRSYITIFTHHMMPNSTQPLAPCYPVFTYLGNQLLCSWWRIPIHSCPWSANNCPTLC